MTRGRPILILGWKVQGQMCTLKFASFPHNNFITFWHTMMILHIWVDHDPRRTSVDFGVKGQGQIRTFNFVPFPHDSSVTFWHIIMAVCLFVRLSVEEWFPQDNFIAFWPTMMILHICIAHDRRKTHIDFGVKKSRSDLYFEVCMVPHDNSHYLLTYNDDTSHISCSWPKEDLYWFGGQ